MQLLLPLVGSRGFIHIPTGVQVPPGVRAGERIESRPQEATRLSMSAPTVEGSSSGMNKRSTAHLRMRRRRR
eukprot:9105855-Pyramimonas_sp.AAC.1